MVCEDSNDEGERRDHLKQCEWLGCSVIIVVDFAVFRQRKLLYPPSGVLATYRLRLAKKVSKLYYIAIIFASWLSVTSTTWYALHLWNISLFQNTYDGPTEARRKRRGTTNE